jgi:TPR repeat protein
MNFKMQMQMLIAVPIIIAAIGIRSSYALEVNEINNENTYQKGLSLYLSEGKKKDAATAAVLFREAADQGHVEAAFSLGVLYQNGEGVPQDNKEAIKWYTKAADHNHPKAHLT